MTLIVYIESIKITLDVEGNVEPTIANLKELKKPLYFAVWSGEEEGVIGSSSFIKDWKFQTKTDFKTQFTSDNVIPFR